MFPTAFQTNRLTLRPIAPADSGAIFETYAQDTEVTRFLTWRPHRDRAATDAYIGHCIAAPAAVSQTYVLIGRDDGVLRGALDLRRPVPRRIEFGYVLARQWWGQGLMTEVLTETVRWAMAQDDIFRAGAVCDVENIASARVMEKAGLAREGVLRRWLVHPNLGDEPRDCVSYARVREP
jgi:ribosomal-protein-alanine N-acetyltransferase